MARGHTAHSTGEEAVEETNMLQVYRDFAGKHLPFLLFVA